MNSPSPSKPPLPPVSGEPGIAVEDARDAGGRLPRRDLILIPLVAILTASTVLGGAEVVSRRVFAERGSFTCGDPATDGPPFHHTPNCVTYYKNPEGPDVEYRFNACGFRSTKACGPKPEGTFRIALIGTSITMGYLVRNEETFAFLTQQALDRECSRPVEVQNMAALVDLTNQPELADRSVALNPDLVVLTVAPYDVEEHVRAPKTEPAARVSWTARLRALPGRVIGNVRDVRFVFAAAHFMLLSEQGLYQTFLSRGGSRDIMSLPLNATGERSYAEFGRILDQVQAPLQKNGIPLLVMAVPNRPAAAMVSNGSRLDGIDARLFGQEIGRIARAHGAMTVDATDEFAGYPHAEQLFYAVDNHPTGAGHALIAHALVGRLTDGSTPGLAGCRVARAGGR